MPSPYGKPNAGNGLHQHFQVMIDEAQATPRARIGSTIGRLDAPVMVAVDRALALFLGFA